MKTCDRRTVVLIALLSIQCITLIHPLNVAASSIQQLAPIQQQDLIDQMRRAMEVKKLQLEIQAKEKELERQKAGSSAVPSKRTDVSAFRFLVEACREAQRAMGWPYQ